nr:winged helix-turn-helix domain-containing protein [Acidiferrobacterales bacterium]
MEILGLLAQGNGQVVLREDMLDEHSSDEGVTRAVSILRKTLKKVGSEKDYIETIPKRGYRLLVSVSSSYLVEDDKPEQSSTKSAQTASLAVLAFIDLSENQDQGYLSDGVSEEIINALVRLPFLRVTGRTSSFSFKDTNTKVREIANALNVSHILEGSLRRHKDRIRITAQLIEAQNDKHLWS